MQRLLVIAFCVPSCLTDTYNLNAVFCLWMWMFILNSTNIRNAKFFESPNYTLGLSKTLHFEYSLNLKWNILLYFLLEVLDILFRHMASWILSNTTDKNQKVTDSVRNLIMGHVWVFQLYTNPNTNLKNNTKISHWAQNQASAMAIPVLWPEP